MRVSPLPYPPRRTNPRPGAYLRGGPLTTRSGAGGRRRSVHGDARCDRPDHKREHGREEGISERASVSRVVEDRQERDEEAARPDQRDKPSPAWKETRP